LFRDFARNKRPLAGQLKRTLAGCTLFIIADAASGDEGRAGPWWTS